MSKSIIYTTEDGQSWIQLRADSGSVWLSFFVVSPDNLGLHLKNIYGDGELVREATTEESSVVQMEGASDMEGPSSV